MDIGEDDVDRFRVPEPPGKRKLWSHFPFIMYSAKEHNGNETVTVRKCSCRELHLKIHLAKCCNMFRHPKTRVSQSGEEAPGFCLMKKERV